MAKKQFKAESKKLMELMINSIYTNKDIFLREIISNASDAIDKLHYQSLTDKQITVDKDDFEIKISVDQKARTLTISDNGIGMTKEELETNLGTIAKSGSLAFKEENEKKENIDIIGQFGVGFYSAFMVSSNVTVISRSYKEDKAYSWTSTGVSGYTIEQAEKETYGTDVILTIKESDEENDYDKYLETYTIEGLIKKYSDYITYPIKMDVERTITKDDKEETVTEEEVLNSLVPLWKRDKKKITEEEYNTFYSDKFFDYEKPAKVMHFSLEGLATFNALLYIPSHASYDYYSKEYEKGLQLYSNGVLIMEKCSDLLPDYLSFVKGVVDSPDLPLNISRETLQQSSTLKTIAKSIESKVTKELATMLEKDREKYEEFFKNFGLQLKAHLCNTYGMDKDKIQDLLLFYTSKDKKQITLKEYVDAMPKDQDKIYYACGETVDKADMLPQTELVKSKGYEVLYLVDYGDEFTINILRNYNEKEFINVADSSLDLETEEEKQKLEKLNQENKKMLDKMTKAIEDVKEVKFTHRLQQHPVCLVTEGEISSSMQKTLNMMPNSGDVKATTVLKINANHPIAKKLKTLKGKELENYSKILYNQARLIEGLPIENPTELSNLICKELS